MFFMLKKLLITGLVALAVIFVAAIAGIIIAVVAFFASGELATSLTAHYISGVVGFLTFYFVLAYGAEYAARKGIF